MITVIGFLDLEAFSATFARSHSRSLKDDPTWPGAQTLYLRDGKGDLPVLKDWQSARNILSRIKSEAAQLPLFNGAQPRLGMAMVVSLKPRTYTPWRTSDDPYAQEHVRLFCCMKPCPNALLIYGGSVQNPPPGQVVAVTQQDTHAEANFGVHTVRWLVVDVRRPHED